jgi:hypothetical protein
MATKSEKIHLGIANIMEELECNIWEATMVFCERNGIDAEDIVRQMDTSTISRIKECAMKERMVQRRHIESLVQLHLE